ncbi:HD domain-containing protein [Streptomyces sp. NPDC056399]|uniref:HD domain-containing protein n=1 Tax=Streptomyces sp. NPDC056399 TaxID=3345807 RepID=UPI0035E04C7E
MKVAGGAKRSSADYESVLSQLYRAAGSPPLATLVGSHDLGKATPVFQIQMAMGSSKTNAALLLFRARRHEEQARRLRLAVRCAKALATRGVDVLDGAPINDLFGLLREPAEAVLDQEMPFSGGFVRAAEREARAHEYLAKFLTDAALRDLGVLRFWDEDQTFVVESSPCGVSRLRCSIVPRPPTADACSRVPFEFALAA